jgi:acyl dehydratase
MHAVSMRYAEDLHAGLSYDLGSWTVTREEIIEFGRSWDPQPFHVDEQRARRSYFGGLVASGVHTFAVFQRLAVTGALLDWAAIAGRGARDMRFRKPVRPETTLSGGLTIAEVQVRDHARALTVLNGTLHDQDGDLVFEVIMEILVACRRS